MQIKEFFAHLLAEAKRLPWWAWLLIAAAVYLGYKLISGGSSASNTSGDPLANVLDTSGPSSSGDTTSGDTTSTSDIPPLPAFQGYNFNNGDYSSGEDGVTHTAARVIQQGYDIHDASLANQAQRNAAQALRSRQQGQDIRVANQEAAARLAAANSAQAQRSRQQGQDLRAANAAKNAAAQNKPPTGRRQDVGLGGGPDTHGKQPVYRLQPGEDLYSVSEKLGVPADDLYAENRDRIDAAVREAGLTGMGIYALPAIGNGLELVIPASAL